MPGHLSLIAWVQVREKLVVPMRMQWWRDAVNGIYKAKPIRHPVIQCLHQVLQHSTSHPP